MLAPVVLISYYVLVGCVFVFALRSMVGFSLSHRGIYSFNLLHNYIKIAIFFLPFLESSKVFPVIFLS